MDHNLNRSAEIKDLAAALAKAQGQMETAEKSGVNPAFKRDGKASTYATLASVWNAVREPLSKNGLSIRQSPRTADGGVEVETELLHESGQFIKDVLWLPCPTMTVHTVGSMITYLRRYTLMAIVGIAPEDDDGNAATDAHKPGVPGSAGGGTEFRPATRRMQPSYGAEDAGWQPVGHGPTRRMQPSSANGRRMANDDAHLVDDTRNKGTTGKPPPADDRAQKIAARAKAWNENAISTLRLSGQSKASLSRFLVDHHEQIRFLEDHAPAEHERFFEAYNEAVEKADALEGA